MARFIVEKLRVGLFDSSQNLIGVLTPTFDNALVCEVFESSGKVVFELETDSKLVSTINSISGAAYVQVGISVYRSTSSVWGTSEAYIHTPSPTGTSIAGSTVLAAFSDIAGTDVATSTQVSTSYTFDRNSGATLPGGDTSGAGTITVVSGLVGLIIGSSSGHSFQNEHVIAYFSTNDMELLPLYDIDGLERVERSSNGCNVAITGYKHGDAQVRQRQILGKGQGFWYPLN